MVLKSPLFTNQVPERQDIRSANLKEAPVLSN